MKNRIITALILLAFVVPLIFLGGIPYLVGISIIIGISTHELLNTNKSPVWVQIIGVLLVVFGIIYSWFSIDKPFLEFNSLFIIVPVLTFFTISIWDKKRTLMDASYNSLMTILMIMFGNALLEIRTTFGNLNLLLYLLITTFAVDIFALFIGCKIGKHKLNPRISPKKSIEGAVGGAICGLVLGTLFALICPINHAATPGFLEIAFAPNFEFSNIISMVSLTFVLTIVGQIGDLAFSMIKRHYQIKDFSNILPGHGGFADRIDSSCFNAIALVAILSMFLVL